MIKVVQEPVHRNQEKTPRSEYNRLEPKTSAIFSYDKFYFYAELDINVESKIPGIYSVPRLHNHIRVTDSTLKRYLKKDHLMSASRVGERADRTFALLFQDVGLVVTNFKDFSCVITPNTDAR